MNVLAINIGNTLLEINSVALEIIGVEPILVASVIIFVSMLAKVLNIRARVGKYSKPVLISVTVIVSVLLAMFAIPHETATEAARNGFVLACVSALIRNFGKPFFVGTKNFLYKKFEERTGEKVVEEPDDGGR